MAVPKVALMLEPASSRKQAASPAGPLQLLKLPVPWMLRLAGQHLDAGSKNAVFQSCRQLRDLILACSDNVKCILSSSKPADMGHAMAHALMTLGPGAIWQPPQPSEISPSAAAQALRHLNLCKEGAAVKLILEGPPQFSDEDRIAAFQVWLQQLCVSASHIPGTPLKHVTSVEIKGVLLGSLIPPTIAMHCCNMRTFIRTADMERCLNTPAPIVHCPRLEELEFSSAFQAPSRFGARAGSSVQTPDQILQQQLQSLPNLQSIICEFNYYEGSRANDGAVQWVFHGFRTVASQLTKLNIRAYSCAKDAVEVPQPLLTLSWPQLRCLEMPQMSLSKSQAMQLLQQAPQLTDLAVFQLEVSACMTDKQCTWERLSIGKVGFMLIAELHLPALRELRIGCLHIEDTDAQDAEAAVKALEQLTVCPDNDDKALPLQFHCPPPAAGADQVLQVLRRLHTGHLRILGNAPHALDGGWLQLLGQLGSHTLTIHADAIKQGCWADVLAYFPAVKVLQVHKGMGPYHKYLCSGILSAQLTALCICANRPITLHLDKETLRNVGYRWREQAEEFVKAVGQAQVLICCPEPVHDTEVGW